MHNQQLLSVSNDAKTVKGEKFGYITHVLYLAAGNTSGHEVCHWRNDECFKVCEDYEMWLRVSSKEEVGFLKEKSVLIKNFLILSIYLKD